MNDKVGFTIRFLTYHTNLFFRCCSSARGVEFAYQKPFFDNMDVEPQHLHYDFRKLCYEALFYYMVGLEWENLGSDKHTSLVIGDEVDETLLWQSMTCIVINIFSLQVAQRKSQV